MDKESRVIRIYDKELIEYLNLTYKFLNISKTEIDTEHLKQIINALKSNQYEIVHERVQTRSIPNKNDYVILSEYIKKTHSNENISNDEIEYFDKYVNKHRFMEMAVNKNYENLFEYLSGENNIKKDDLTLLYQYLTGTIIKSMSSAKLLKEIQNYIYKTLHFDDMDQHFSTRSKLNKSK